MLLSCRRLRNRGSWAFNATVEVTPAMTIQDLAKAGPAIERAVKKYGQGAQAASAR